jgi:hypothetical protein
MSVGKMPFGIAMFGKTPFGIATFGKNLKIVCTLVGFEPGPSLPVADAMTAAPRRQGILHS